jgi:hypothetical protein
VKEKWRLFRLSTGKLTSEQQRLLATDLVDHYPGATPDEAPALDRALAAMGGTDLVEFMRGRDINQGEPPLAAIHNVEKEKQASRAAYKVILEQIDEEEKAAQETNAREAARSQR